MDNRQQILENFNKTWPLARIKSMTLEEYTLGNTNYKETFSYWIETETLSLGDISGIGGGGSFKHGIYYMSNKKEFTGNKINDAKFAWLKKYGDDSQAAFTLIKSLLINVVESAQSGRWDKIDEIDFFAPVKWKWAFLYSNKALFTVYKKEALEVASEQLGMAKGNWSYPALIQFLINSKTEQETCFDLGDKIWKLYKENVPCKHYILGSKYGKNSTVDVFPKMHDRKVISTGFALQLDLEDFIGKPQKEIVNYLKENNEEQNSYNCLKYFLNIQPGDKIAIKASGGPLRGEGFLSIVGIAEAVESEAYYVHDPDDLGHTLTIKWIDAPIYKEFNLGGYGRTIHKLTDKNVIDQIFNSEYEQEPIMSEGVKKKSVMQNIPLNQILYGPPGTGKTYNTINHALEICGENTAGLTRQKIKAKFNDLEAQGRIVFTTFHQSMTYEDFIEGIKPVEPEKEGDPVIYRVEEGVFRKLCIEASFSLAKENESAETESVLDFSLAFDEYVQELEERLASEEKVELNSKNGGKVLVDGISSNGNIIIKHRGGVRTYTVSKLRLSKLQKEISNLEDVSNINNQFRAIIGGSNTSAYWSVLNAIRNNNFKPILSKKEERKYTWGDKKQVVQTLGKQDFENKKGLPFVLIIDEINRGNVSQIFGELITLIEDDKRLGNDEALLVQLPYSKESFSVPPNLHIIGTMNTADRSVEALDSALRRRFSFTEIPPDSSLLEPKNMILSLWNKDAFFNVSWNNKLFRAHADSLYEFLGIDKEFEKYFHDSKFNNSELWTIKDFENINNELFSGINLKSILDTINKRIEKLLDKDHMIGHSYFLIVKSIVDLKCVFQNKIIPLLQEYFFGDYGKIGLVLGSGFLYEYDNQGDDDFFASFDEYESASLGERKIYHLFDLKDMNDSKFKEAINTLLRKQ